MPQRSVYIRKEDDKQWMAHPDKAGLVRDALARERSESPFEVQDIHKGEPELHPRTMTIKTPFEAKKVVKPAESLLESSLCPHGNPWMTCKVASCNIKGRKMGLTT